jgi:hypothetical protein
MELHNAFRADRVRVSMSEGGLKLHYISLPNWNMREAPVQRRPRGVAAADRSDFRAGIIPACAGLNRASRSHVRSTRGRGPS